MSGSVRGNDDPLRGNAKSEKSKTKIAKRRGILGLLCFQQSVGHGYDWNERNLTPCDQVIPRAKPSTLLPAIKYANDMSRKYVGAVKVPPIPSAGTVAVEAAKHDEGDHHGWLVGTLRSASARSPRGRPHRISTAQLFAHVAWRHLQRSPVQGCRVSLRPNLPCANRKRPTR